MHSEVKMCLTGQGSRDIDKMHSTTFVSEITKERSSARVQHRISIKHYWKVTSVLVKFREVSREFYSTQ